MIRALAGGLVLAAEYLVLAVLFDGSELIEGGDWLLGFGRVGSLVSITVAVFTAGLLVRGGELLARLGAAASHLGPLEPRWVVAHVAAFLAFIALTSRVFSGGTVSSSSDAAFMIAAWFAGGVASFATLFRLSFGSAWRRVAVALRGLFAAGLLLGLCAWFVGLRTLPLWDWLAGASLQTSAWMLIPFADSVHVIPDEMLLGVGDFEVTIAAECSGMENLGGVSVFLLGYFYAFRHQLRFPQSFLLVPLALGAVWLINSMRIAGLILVGANFSADVALGGFHSKAGWLGLCLVALAVVVGTRNSPRFAWAEPQQRSTFTDSATAAYLLPLLTYVGVGLVTGLFASGVDWLYPVQVVAGAAVAWSYRQEYPKPIRHLPWWGLLMGAVAFALWVAFERTPVEEPHEAHEQGLAEASSWLRNTWLFFRVLGAVALVPVIEELAFRGFLQRRVIGEDFTSVAQDKFTWFSLGVSALAFGLLHESWLAGVLAGVAYSIACYRRGRLEEAVVAHAVTNGLLVVASLGLGYRHLWH